MIETHTLIDNKNSDKEKSVSLKLKNKKDITVKKDKINNKKELKKMYDIYAETIWLTGC